MSTVRDYYTLTKPGIIRGNLITAIAGYFFGAKGAIDIVVLLALCVGVTGVIGAGCVFNNIVDAQIDSFMQRTKKRALVTGAIQRKQAIIFGVLLAFIGFSALIVYVNIITAVIGVIALFLYVVVYGYAKRKSWHGTLVGSFPGAAAILAGFTAATGAVTTAGILITLSMVLWQMPHFYAIAIFRLQEYRAAGLPVLPAVKGLAVTRLQILIYIFLFGLITIALSVGGYASIWFAVCMGIVSLYWFFVALTGYSSRNSNKWARKVFGVSLIVLIIFSVLLSIDNTLP